MFLECIIVSIKQIPTIYDHKLWEGLDNQENINKWVKVLKRLIELGKNLKKDGVPMVTQRNVMCRICGKNPAIWEIGGICWTCDGLKMKELEESTMMTKNTHTVRSGDQWSDEAKDKLRIHAPKQDANDLVKMFPGRSLESVKGILYQMGWRKKQGDVGWYPLTVEASKLSDERIHRKDIDTKLLEQTYNRFSDEQLAILFETDVETIYSLRNTLSLHRNEKITTLMRNKQTNSKLYNYNEMTFIAKYIRTVPLRVMAEWFRKSYKAFFDNVNSMGLAKIVVSKRVEQQQPNMVFHIENEDWMLLHGPKPVSKVEEEIAEVKESSTNLEYLDRALDVLDERSGRGKMANKIKTPTLLYSLINTLKIDNKELDDSIIFHSRSKKKTYIIRATLTEVTANELLEAVNNGVEIEYVD